MVYDVRKFHQPCMLSVAFLADNIHTTLASRTAAAVWTVGVNCTIS